MQTNPWGALLRERAESERILRHCVWMALGTCVLTIRAGVRAKCPPNLALASAAAAFVCGLLCSVGRGVACVEHCVCMCRGRANVRVCAASLQAPAHSSYVSGMGCIQVCDVCVLLPCVACIATCYYLRPIASRDTLAPAVGAASASHTQLTCLTTRSAAGLLTWWGCLLLLCISG
jgi:hypothetical protein